MGVGRLGNLLHTSSRFKSAAESKGKAPAASPESTVGSRMPTLGIDTRLLKTLGPRQSYGTIGDQRSNGGPSSAYSQGSEIYRNGRLLFNVPEEVDDQDLEVLLDDEGLYLGSYNHLVRIYTIVPITSLLVWLLLAFVPPLIWPTRPPETPHAPYFATPLPELLLSISLFALSHLLNPYLFAFAGALLPHPTATSVLGTALHVVLRNALRTAAFPVLAIPGGSATFRAPAFRRVWWLALGWSFAEVAAGIAQGYEMLALYRDVLVPENAALELVTSASAAAAVAASPTWTPCKKGGSDRASPPPAEDERLRESLSRGEDGGPGASIAAGSPVRGRCQRQEESSCHEAWTAADDVDIRLEVDKDFDELVAVKAREELEELYGIPAIRIPVFVSCLLRIASIFLSLGIVLLLSAGYLTSPLALPPSAEDVSTASIPPSWSSNLFWGTFLGVCAVNWCLSLLHTSVFLPRVGVHVVAYLGLLIGLGTLFAGLAVWDALS